MHTIIALARELEALDIRRTEIIAAIHAATAPSNGSNGAPAVDPRQMSLLTGEPAVLVVPAGNPPDEFADRLPDLKGKRALTATIRAVLVGNPSGVDISVISASTGIEKRMVSNTLNRMKATGKATMISRGVWGPG